MAKKYPQHAREAEFANQATGLSARNVQDALVEIAGADWVSWTPTGTWTGNVTYSGYYRVSNGLLHCIGEVLCGAGPTPASNLEIDFPPAYVFNPNVGLAWNHIVGHLVARDTSPAQSYPGVCVFDGVSSNVNMYVFNAASTYASHAAITPTVPISFVANDYIRFNFTIPVVEA